MAERIKKDDIAGKEIQRLWGNTPVVDSTKDLQVIIRPCDVESASRKDAGGCVFAQACKRLYGSTKVLFFRRIAYVELPQEDGTLLVQRFMLGKGMRKLIEDFDRGDAVLPVAGFTMKAVSKGKQLDHCRVRKQERTARLKLLGRTAPITADKDKIRQAKPLVVDLAVRSGTGAVHFTVKNE